MISGTVSCLDCRFFVLKHSTFLRLHPPWRLSKRNTLALRFDQFSAYFGLPLFCLVNNLCGQVFSCLANTVFLILFNGFTSFEDCGQPSVRLCVCVCNCCPVFVTCTRNALSLRYTCTQIEMTVKSFCRPNVVP